MQDLGTIPPSREEFRARAAGTRVIPVHIKILADSLTPIGIYRSLVLQDDQGAPSRPPTAPSCSNRDDFFRGRVCLVGTLLIHRCVLPLDPHHR